MKQPRRIAWLVASGAVLGAGLLLALCSRSTMSNEVVPSDGSRLKLLRVTTSRHPTYCFGNPLQKVCSVLPGKAGEKLSGGTRIEGGSYAQPALAIWFTESGTMSTWFNARFVAEDDLTWTAARCMSASLKNQNAGGIIAEVWPRRAKEWKVQVGGNPGWVTFRISNPDIVHCEQWNPESLPAARRVDDAEFSLQAVEVDPYPVFPSHDSKGSQMATLYFRIGEHGQPATTWLPSSITMQDATGNSVACVDWNPPALASSPLFPSNTIAWSGDWPAVPGENAVKVVVEFVSKTQRRVKLEWIVAAAGTVAKPAAAK